MRRSLRALRTATVFPFYAVAFLLAFIARMVWLALAWTWASVANGLHDGWSR
jgi:hypothetical protein